MSFALLGLLDHIVLMLCIGLLFHVSWDDAKPQTFVLSRYQSCYRASPFRVHHHATQPGSEAEVVANAATRHNCEVHLLQGLPFAASKTCGSNAHDYNGIMTCLSLHIAKSIVVS